MKVKVTQEIELNEEDAKAITLKYLSDKLDRVVRNMPNIKPFYSITKQGGVMTWYEYHAGESDVENVGYLSAHDMRIYHTINYLKDQNHE